MPPRKSNISQVSATGDEATPSKEREGINIEDLSLPRTMVQRLAKGVLPPNTQIQKDAITAMSKAATVFISYLSQAANTTPIPTTRKTISPAAVLEALADLEFESFLPRVQAELQRFNEVQTGKRNEYRRKLKEKEEGRKEAEGGGGGGGGGGGVGDEDEEGIDGSEERARKRVRREEGDDGGEEPKGPVSDGEGRDILGVEEEGDEEGEEQEEEGEDSSQDEEEENKEQEDEELGSIDVEERRGGSESSEEEDSE